jgi:hypothetical protein
MRLTAIGLAMALMLTGTTAFAMGAGGGSGGVESTYTSNPAKCDGPVCSAKPHSALTAHDPHHKRLRGHQAWTR